MSQNLKFFRGNSAKVQNAGVGAIWFDTDNNVIKVCTKIDESGVKTWEAYSGLQNAEWNKETNKLVFTKPDGVTVVEIDFSDVASKEAILQKFAGLKVEDTAVTGEYVSSVSQSDGKITVTRAALPDYTEVYDAKGAAATAEQNAKNYTDALANGAVADNTAAIAKLNGNATTDGSVAKSIADAKAVIDAYTVNGKAISGNPVIGSSDISRENGKTVEASIAALETAVGEGGSVDDKIAGVKAIIGDTYSAESTVADDISGIKDSLADNTEAIETLNGTGEGSVDAKITAAFNDFSSKVSDDSVVNTYKELIDYAAEHGAEFTTLVGEVAKKANADDVYTKTAADAAFDSKGSAAQALVDAKADAASLYQPKGDYEAAGTAAGLNTAMDARVKVLEAIDHNAYKQYVDDAVLALDATVQDESDYIVGSVAQEDGKLTSVAFTAKTGSVADNSDALAVASDVKTYVDTKVTSGLEWAEF